MSSPAAAGPGSARGAASNKSSGLYATSMLPDMKTEVGEKTEKHVRDVIDRVNIRR